MLCLDVFVCLHFTKILKACIIVYIYIYMILFAYKMPIFTLLATKCFKKINGLLRVVVNVNVW
jgi:hypothetical protein